jgi:hypothetical protein
LQLKWVRGSYCGLVADNVGRVAVIVGRCSLLVAINPVQKVALIAVLTVFDCEPLYLEVSDRLFHAHSWRYESRLEHRRHARH